MKIAVWIIQSQYRKVTALIESKDGLTANAHGVSLAVAPSPNS